MNILFIIDMKLLMLFNWSYMSNLFQTHVILVSALGSTSINKPLKSGVCLRWVIELGLLTKHCTKVCGPITDTSNSHILLAVRCDRELSHHPVSKCDRWRFLSQVFKIGVEFQELEEVKWSSSVSLSSRTDLPNFVKTKSARHRLWSGAASCSHGLFGFLFVYFFLWHERVGALHCAEVSGPIMDTSNSTYTFGCQVDGITKSLIIWLAIVNDEDCYVTC